MSSGRLGLLARKGMVSAGGQKTGTDGYFPLFPPRISNDLDGTQVPGNTRLLRARLDGASRSGKSETSPSVPDLFYCYSIQYGVPDSSVTILKKPHTCDFLSAPIGEKGCHYEPDVTAVRTGTDRVGKAIVSFDDGVTWVDDCVPPTKTNVRVTWKKVDEDG